MNPIAALRARLLRRADGEHEQAILRIVIFGWVLAYIAAIYFPGDAVTGRGHGDLLLLQGLMAALVVALVLFRAICVWPAPNVPRRVIAMVADAGAATFCMFLAGEAGVSMVGVYLFVIFGNGFRYGTRYLFACQALCLIGFIGVLLYVPFWQAHGVTGWCLMLTLLVIPLYVSTLLKRIQESRARTEQALKECLERGRTDID
jgi:two-component system, sensor histidine kinase RpfC